MGIDRQDMAVPGSWEKAWFIANENEDNLKFLILQFLFVSPTVFNPQGVVVQLPLNLHVALSRKEEDLW